MEAISWQARWVRIDLAAIRHNYRQVRKGLDAKVRLLAVVKGDAYGHGAPEISRTMQELGADMLGVTTVSEGVDLRKNGITMPILVFSPFFPHEADTIAEYGLTATVASLEAAEWLGRAAQRQDKSIAVHLKAETGMGRTGLWPAEIREAADAISDIAA